MDVPRALIAAVVAAGLLLTGCGAGSDEVGSSGPGGRPATSTRPDGSSSSSISKPSTSNPGTGSPGASSPSPSTPGSDGPGTPGSVAPADPGPDTPVSSPPGTDVTVPEPTPTEVPNRHDLIDPRPHVPERVVVDPADPRRLLVRFWGGIPECYGAEATVRESPTEVVVALRSGRIPGGAEVCIDLAQYQQITVTLAAPLGSRAIRTDPA